LIPHLVKWDDRHLLAHAMASDFSAAWQCLSKRTIFLLRIKLHALNRQGVSPPRRLPFFKLGIKMLFDWKTRQNFPVQPRRFCKLNDRTQKKHLFEFLSCNFVRKVFQSRIVSKLGILESLFYINTCSEGCQQMQAWI
jgi:hypothetical protein